MMKSKVVRGIINGGVLAAVAALGITVYQLGTKPLTESKDDSVQMEETGLEEEISDEGDAEVSGSGSTEEADGSGIADGDSVKNAAVDADGMADSSGTGDVADGGSSAAGTGAAAANANESNSAAVAGVNGSAVSKAAGKLADVELNAAAGSELVAGDVVLGKVTAEVDQAKGGALIGNLSGSVLDALNNAADGTITITQKKDAGNKLLDQYEVKDGNNTKATLTQAQLKTMGVKIEMESDRAEGFTGWIIHKGRRC